MILSLATSVVLASSALSPPYVDETEAVSILLSPPGSPACCPNENEFSTKASVIRAVAVRWQILDERECRYTLVVRADWVRDIDMIRHRRLELADAPLVEDLSRFPSCESLNGLASFNRRFRKHIEERWELEFDRRSYYEVVMGECDQQYLLIDNLRDYITPFFYVTTRRSAAKSYRQMVGDKMFYSGHLPETFPGHRFNELR